MIWNIKAKLAKLHKSWTIWFNSVVASAVVALPILQDNIPQLQSYLSADVYRYLMGAIIAGNILLRFKTNKPLEAK